MGLPDYFEFSQSSLQDYIDCRRRFQLRYLLRIAWPAIQAEPVQDFERHIQRGERFHRLIQQWLLGVPPEKIARVAANDEDGHLQVWWDHFTSELPPAITGERFVEITVTAPIGSYHLVAKYDLVLIQSNHKVIIYDWKTNTHRPKRASILERMQTRVYPYLLVQAGSALNQGKPISPNQIEMIYWFSDPEMSPERISYSEHLYEEDHSYLAGLIQEIESLDTDQFDLTISQNQCNYCVYRSLCNRGIKAANFDQEDEPEVETGQTGALDFSLDQIGEISF